MKKYLIMTLLLLVFGLTSLAAHPAGMVNANFDKEKSNLTVSFSHKVSAPASHYINQINVLVNKKVVITQNLSIQETEAGGSFYYKLIDIKPGDKITVTTNCNKIGKKSIEIIAK